MLWVKILIPILCISQMVWANEHGEAPKENAGNGGAPAAAEDHYSGKQTQQWSEVQSKLSALKGKVDAQEAVVKSLILERGATGHGAPAGGHGGAPAGHGSDEAMAARIEQLKKEHEKLQSLVAEYNKMNTDYETRFPEKGLKENRIYRRVDPQAIQPDEAVSSYEERVQRLQNRILRQYPKSSSKLKTASSEVKKSKKPVPKEKEKPHEAPKSGDVTDQIILQK